jgi:hypothetical protein
MCEFHDVALKGQRLLEAQIKRAEQNEKMEAALEATRLNHIEIKVLFFISELNCDMN